MSVGVNEHQRSSEVSSTTSKQSGSSQTRMGNGQRMVFYWRHYIADVLAWCAALALGAAIRFDGMAVSIDWGAVARLMVVAALLQVLFGSLLMVYRGRHPWGSFEGFIDVVATASITALAMWLWTVFAPEYAQVPRSLVLIATPFAVVMMAGIRYMARMVRQRYTKPKESGTPVLLYGAGYLGDTIARLLTTDKNSEMVPVGLLDDDPSKRRLRLHGIEVLGTIGDLDEVAKSTGAKVLIVAVGDPSPQLLERVRSLAKASELRVQLMPSTTQILKEGVSPTNLRDLDIEDLLGREQVDTDVSAIAGYLNGKRVLITGAGGSIGQQLCFEINKHGPGELIMLDRDETGLQQTGIRVRGNGLLNTNEAVLADIRDRATLERIFAERKPEVVFHAAALKHLPMLERYPDEAWSTNVLGTLNVLEAARMAGVEVLINISTDKAANPTSVLGISKRVAERLTSWAGTESNLRYLSVRFGNVIGSRGSMLPTFRSLIEEGKPLTVTHPDITRYFMTIPEACQLVLQAGAIGRTGEVLILDMGEPVKIYDIAKKMIALSGKTVEIKITGLREGEKLHEDLHGELEVDSNPFHEKISHAAVEGLPATELSKEAWNELLLTKPEDRPTVIRGYESPASGEEPQVKP